jgi:putative peptidoglycan lipid II flippase
MDNDKQQSQLPPQWVYDQEQPPAAPAGPFHAYNYPPQPENNQQFPPAPSPYDYDPNLTMDMGNSLGYGQTMDFHASSMPQPTTSIPRIREKRFKELREKRTRNKPARGYPDVEALQQRKASGLLANDSTLIPGKTIIGSLFGRGKATKRGVRPGTPEDWSASGVYGMPGDWSGSGVQGAPGDWSGSGVQGAPGVLGGPNVIPNGSTNQNGVLVAAGQGAQDTGMIQRVKVARAAFLITGAFMFSSILGLVRTFLFSYVFGATGVSTAYIQAYLIPNLLYTVVAGGALSSAFIPVFTRYAEGLKDEKSAWHIASSALNLAVVVMISLSFVAFLLAPILVPLYTPVVPGFTLADQELTVTLTRIMLLQAIVLGSGVIISSVLNAKQDFTRTAIGTILYNVGLIIGLLPGFFLASHTRTGVSNIAVYSATWSVVLAAALQVGIQIPGLFKVKMRYTFSFDWKHPGVRQIGRQMIPRAINAAMLSFSTVVDRYLLLFLGNIGNPQIVSGLIPEYFQAFSILVLPVSIFGSSVSTAAFPALASYVARERFDRVRSIIMETLRSILFLSIPSSVGLIVLALPIIQVLLEHGTRFTLQNAQLTAVPLAFFALGLPGLAAVEILTRAFYSLRDSKTPVVISVAQFILKIALSIVLINVAVFGLQWGMAALAFSTAVASTIEAVVLFILLYRRIGGFDLRALVSFLGRALVASLGMGVALFIVRNVLDRLINTTTSYTLSVSGIFHALLKLLIELGIGSLVFLIIARRLNIEEMESGPVRKILNRLHVAWL